LRLFGLRLIIPIRSDPSFSENQPKRERILEDQPKGLIRLFQALTSVLFEQKIEALTLLIFGFRDSKHEFDIIPRVRYFRVLDKDMKL